MKSTFRFACAALLAVAATPALALQLGQIQVKSSLNQPLVAAIPLHPKSMTELEGLTVGLAPASDFARAGLKVTPTDQSLRFHVVTDNNGQKLILVTSARPITDPYLDFLVEVNTRQGKQVREFVVLLNPVISAPAPAVQSAPTTATGIGSEPRPVPPPAANQATQAQPAPASAPPAAAASAPAQPEPQPRPQPQPAPVARAAPPPPAAVGNAASGPVHVKRGDTLYRIATKATRGSDVTVNQMMLALKAVNPDAFFKDNINDLKAGAILRIPTRDQIDRRSAAQATAEVRRQYQAWRAAKPHPATMLAGTAAEAAANSEAQPEGNAPASDHLSLVPPSGEGGGTSNRPGVAGGTGSETVAGLRRQLQNDKGSLVSIKQSNADLESRVTSLQDIADKSDKLLSLKDATIAELQHKLAQVQGGTAAGAASVAAAAGTSAAGVAQPGAASNAGATSAPGVKSSAVASPAASAAVHHQKTPAGTGQPWYLRPLNWIIAAVVLVVLIVLGLLWHRRGRGEAPARGPLADPEDIAATGDGSEPVAETANDEQSLHARLAGHPGDLAAHLRLCRLYYARGQADRFVESAEAMREEVSDLDCVEWREVIVMGRSLAPHHHLFAAHADESDDPYGLAALRRPAGPDSGAPDGGDDATVVRPPAAETGSMDEHALEPDAMPPSPEPPAVPPAARTPSPDIAADRAFSDDPVDTKLDLARAYIDMGDPVGARAMLEEVLREGSQLQRDEAQRLLAEAGAGQ